MNLSEAYKKTEDMYRQYAEYCVKVVQFYTPVRSGRLRNSIVAERIDDVTYTIAITATAADGTLYGKLVNDGRGPVYPSGNINSRSYRSDGPKWLKWSDGTYHRKSGPAKATHFYDDARAALKGGK